MKKIELMNVDYNSGRTNIPDFVFIDLKSGVLIRIRGNGYSTNISKDDPDFVSDIVNFSDWLSTQSYENDTIFNEDWFAHTLDSYRHEQ